MVIIWIFAVIFAALLRLLGTLVVSQGEVGVVGHLRCQAVGETLSALRVIHVNCPHHVDQLDHINRHVQSTTEPVNRWPATCTALYLPRFGVFTHVRLQVLRQRGWVVVHICDLYGHRDAGDLWRVICGDTHHTRLHLRHLVSKWFGGGWLAVSRALCFSFLFSGNRIS